MGKLDGEAEGSGEKVWTYLKWIDKMKMEEEAALVDAEETKMMMEEKAAPAKDNELAKELAKIKVMGPVMSGIRMAILLGPVLLSGITC